MENKISNSEEWIRLNLKQDFYITSVRFFQPTSSYNRMKNIVIKFLDAPMYSYTLNNKEGWNRLTITNATVSRYLVIKSQSYYYEYEWTREIPEIEVFGCNPIDCTWSTYGNWSECLGQCDNGTRTSSRLIVEVSQGGKNCSGNGTRIEPCSLAPCPNIHMYIVIGSSSTAGLLLMLMLTSCCLMKKARCSKIHPTERIATGSHGNSKSMQCKELSPMGVSGDISKENEDLQVVENPYYRCENIETEDSTRTRNDFYDSGSTEIVNMSTNIYYGL